MAARNLSPLNPVVTSATRAAALSRLEAFVPRAGRQYADQRNYDDGPGERSNVSQLSPYLTHRLLLEDEVIAAVLQHHSPQGAEKFIQEVLWRTYWKGWLSLRPQVFDDYAEGLDRDEARLRGGGKVQLQRARVGETGIEPFDAWVEELVQTGYLHNHARMWFASIWIFTLRLPWTLGAAFFARHLLDGDPASNTLGWRWVAGLHTRGKHYVARASNIAKYTRGRFDPRGQLDERPSPLHGEPLPPIEPEVVPSLALDLPAGPSTGLLITPEDLSVERGELAGAAVEGIATLPTDGWPARATHVHRFWAEGLADARTRASAHFGCHAMAATDTDELVAWAKSFERIVLFAPHTGWWSDPVLGVLGRLQAHGVEVVTLRRAWDRELFPRATHGFFRFKRVIPGLVDRL